MIFCILRSENRYYLETQQPSSTSFLALPASQPQHLLWAVYSGGSEGMVHLEIALARSVQVGSGGG